jgi:hypothetical protein
MAELKTKVNKKSVKKFLDGVKDEKRRRDAYVVFKLMNKITKTKAKMWGTSIIGYGTYHYKYASGREGEWMRIGFSPRKDSLSLYFACTHDGHKNLLKKLGKHKTGVGCLYIKDLDEVDLKVLEKIIERNWKEKK